MAIERRSRCYSIAVLLEAVEPGECPIRIFLGARPGAELELLAISDMAHDDVRGSVKNGLNFRPF